LEPTGSVEADLRVSSQSVAIYEIVAVNPMLLLEYGDAEDYEARLEEFRIRLGNEM
jgi:hypothetical protein